MLGTGGGGLPGLQTRHRLDHSSEIERRRGPMLACWARCRCCVAFQISRCSHRTISGGGWVISASVISGRHPLTASQTPVTNPDNEDTLDRRSHGEHPRIATCINGCVANGRVRQRYGVTSGPRASRHEAPPPGARIGSYHSRVLNSFSSSRQHAAMGANKSGRQVRSGILSAPVAEYIAWDCWSSVGPAIE